MELDAAFVGAIVAGVVIGLISFIPLVFALRSARPGSEWTMQISIGAIAFSLVFMVLTLLIVRATNLFDLAAYGFAMVGAFLVAAVISVVVVVVRQVRRK
ncbi:MAG: hypothetical protein LUD25_04715 [Coriobacteriaceae bacterium]|nr:hypothetical protein [Coriobacteriaceae bacterium]